MDVTVSFNGDKKIETEEDDAMGHWREEIAVGEGVMDLRRLGANGEYAMNKGIRRIKYYVGGMILESSRIILE